LIGCNALLKMNKDTKRETHFNKAIYKSDNEIYILDYTFTDYWQEHLSFKNKKQGSVFKGATGSVVRIITQEEIQARVADYDWKDIWQMAVESKTTQEGLDDWLNNISENEKSELVVELASHSCYKAIEEVGIKLKDNEKLKYTGGGRCFDASEMIEKRNSKNIKIFEPALYDFIISIEYDLPEALKEQKALLEINRQYEKDKKKNAQIVIALRHLKGLQKALANIR